VADRPYTIVSCCTSLDGYLDDGAPDRLVLSNRLDLDRVDGLRASCDAILVGAATVRRDNPRLVVRSVGRQEDRAARGQSPSPVKVTVTSGADLDPGAAFFTCGQSDRIVYCAGDSAPNARERLGAVATVVDAGQPVRMDWVAADLHARGVRRLLVEGGGRVLTQFLTAGLVDELHLAVAPFFIGDPRGRRFVGAGPFPWDAGHRADLVEVRRIEDVVLMRYALAPPSAHPGSTSPGSSPVQARPRH
jgi:5-amino-6-(5-phosphoribosylamino)uracil reductase